MDSFKYIQNYTLELLENPPHPRTDTSAHTRTRTNTTYLFHITDCMKKKFTGAKMSFIFVENDGDNHVSNVFSFKSYEIF